jgi:glycosyltransferase involved in cell wall biosynthesis
VNAKVKSYQKLSAADLRIFEQEMIKCPKLPEWIAAHRADYDLFVFLPYMFSTTVNGVAAAGDKAVIIPCLHDEGYVELEWYARMFKSARGLLFNSPPERDLAIRKYGLKPEQYALPGEGLETDWFGDGERFRDEHGLGDYLLFIGRKEVDKNFPMLIEYFRRYRDERGHDLSLVIFGPGGLQADPIDARSVIDFGFAPDAVKRDALAGSLALVQPSVLESFSLTIMESWIAERPVLVHKDCDVTRDHAIRSGGGLWFKSYIEFAACVDRLRDDRALAQRLGAAGRGYVLSNYSWPNVIDQYLSAFERWRGPGLEQRRATS